MEHSCRRIVFVGAPGTGKSTLAHELVVQLKLINKDVEFCPEFARSYLRRSGPVTNAFEQFVMQAGASAREDEMAVHDYVVHDSASFLGEIYFAHHVAMERTPELETKLEVGLQELRRICRQRLALFNHVFFVPVADFSPGKDPQRDYVEARRELDGLMRAYLIDNRVDYHQLRARSQRGRIREVMRVLERAGALA